MTSPTPGERLEWTVAKGIFIIFILIALLAMGRATLGSYRCSAKCEAAGYPESEYAPQYRFHEARCVCLGKQG